MITERCDQRGCTFETKQETVAVARRVIGNHKRRMHNIIGSSASAQWKAKQQGVARKSEEAPVQTQPEVTPNFCPSCGCNLRVITAALNIRRRS